MDRLVEAQILNAEERLWKAVAASDMRLFP